MKIVLKEITVRELVKGYQNNQEEGVVGYDGKLDIRPKYQREFVYKDDKKKAVIDTVMKGFPLNVMYWVNSNADGEDKHEVLDGQQRTLSICEYVAGNFSIQEGEIIKYFHNLTQTEKDQILNYKLMVYFCEGTDKEKLDWFKTINIAGEKLTDQELRNAVYTGKWLTDAKKFFSKTQCPAYNLSNSYIKASPIRQELLEIALDWISGGRIEKYMSENQDEDDATELTKYFKNLITWIEETFTVKRKVMNQVNWGPLYNKFKSTKLKKDALETEIAKLMADPDVSNKAGIYEYVLTGEEKKLSIRAFDEADKITTYEKQKGICVKCKKHFKIDQMDADHITPWSKGGKTHISNLQMLCRRCNQTKSDK